MSLKLTLGRPSSRTQSAQVNALDGVNLREALITVCQVEPAAALGQAGRGEPDRDLPLRPFLAAVDDRGPDSVARLPQRGIGQADQDRPDQAVRNVRLDLDHMAGHAYQGHRVGAGQRHGYPTPRMCSMLNPPVPSYTRPTTSMRT